MKKLLVVAPLLLLFAGGSHARVPVFQGAPDQIDLTWKPYTTFPALASGTRQRASVSVDNDGVIHVAQLTSDYKIIYFNSRFETRKANGFCDPIQVDAAGVNQGVGFPDIWADPLGRVHIVWEKQYSNYGVLGHYTVSPGGTSALEWLNTGVAQHYYHTPQIVASDTGVLHIVVQHVGPSPVWTRPEHAVLTGVPVSFNPISDPIDSTAPRIAVRGTNLCAVWEDGRTAGRTLSYSIGTYAPATGAVSWGTRTSISGTGDQDLNPDVDLDINNQAHFTWYRTSASSPTKVMYYTPGGSTEQVSIATTDFYGPARIRVWDNKIHVFYKGMSHSEKTLGSSTWRHEESLNSPNKSQITSPGPDEVAVFRGRFDLVDATHHVRTYNSLPEGASWVPAFPGASVNIVPINGNLQYRLNLFSSKGVGPCTSLGLTYNTKQAIGSYTGAGWTMDYLMHITVNDDNSIVLTMPDGLYINFTGDATMGYSVADSGFGFVAGIQKLGVTWKMTADGGGEYNFDTSGKLNTVVDPTTGNYLQVNYTGGRPTSIVDQLYTGFAGRTTQLIYGTGTDANHIVQILDHNNKSYRLNYSGTYSGVQLSSVVFEGDVSVPTYSFEYGTSGLMSKVIPPEGIDHGSYGYQIFYDGAGRVEHIEDPIESYLIEGAADNAAATTQIAKLRFVYNDTDATTTGVIGPGKFCTRVLSRRHAAAPVLLDHSTVSVFNPSQKYGVSEVWDAAALMQVSNIKPILREFDSFGFGNVTKLTDRWGFVTEYDYRPPIAAAPWLTNLVQTIKKPDPFAVTNSLVESFTYSNDVYGNVTSHTTIATPTGTSASVSRTTNYAYVGGRLTTTTYPNLTRPDIVDQFNIQSTNVYGGPRNQLTQTINAEGRSTYYSGFGSPHGLPTQVTRDGGGGMELTSYDVMGNVTSTQRPRGQTFNDPTLPTVLGLDGLYRVRTISDPAGNITTNSYDRESHLISVLPSIGSATTTDYDHRGLVKGGSTPDGTWTQVVDAHGNVRQKKSIRDGYTYVAFDHLDRVIRTTLPGSSAYTGSGGGGGGPDMVILKSYEEVDSGNGERFALETRVKASADRVTRTVFDNRQRPIGVTAPDNLTKTETFYDEQDQVVATQLRYATVVQTATLTYRDARDRIEHVRLQDKGYLEVLGGQIPGHLSDAYTIRNKVGSVVQTVDPMGNPALPDLAHKTTYTLDARERVTHITDGKGVVVRENVWGDDDLLIEAKIPDPATKSATPRVTAETRTYTARKEPKTVFNRNGTGLTYTYNTIQGQVNTIEDVQHRITQTTYYLSTQRVDLVTVAFGTPPDGSGVPQSRQTKSVWDKGMLSEIVVWNPNPVGGNAYNASYKYFYDHAERLERFEAPQVSAERHFYNEFGEDSKLIVGNKTIDHYYNSLGQRTSSVWSGPVYNKTETRLYNEIGLPQLISNAVLVGGVPSPGSLSKQMLYDNWRGTLSTEVFMTGNTTWKIQTHSYDPARNYIGLADGENFFHEWVYDANNRVEEIRYKNQPVCKAFFTPGGLVDRTQIHNAAGVAIAETTHRYDGLARKTAQETVSLATRQAMAAFEWGYDTLDLVTSIKANHLGVKADLQYNVRRELTQEAWTGNGGGPNAPLPNPTVFGAASTPNQSVPSNEGQGKLLSGLPVSAVTKAYTYDPAGNRKKLTVGAAITTYNYNAGSQLTDESTPGVSTVTHLYDEWGNETSRTTTPFGGSAVTESYICNYLNLLADYQKPSVHWQYDYWPTGERYAKTNLNNSSQNELYVPRFGDVVTDYSTPTTLLNTYVQGTGIDTKYTRIPVSGDANRRHYLGDSVGTVSVTLNEAGVGSESTLKDVWGVPFPGTSSIERYGFAQREQDNESGLVHMRARQYEPRYGRFTQTDPILGNRPNQHYAYATSNPLLMVDPCGLAPGDFWDPRTYTWTDLKQGFGETFHKVDDTAASLVFDFASSNLGRALEKDSKELVTAVKEDLDNGIQFPSFGVYQLKQGPDGHFYGPGGRPVDPDEPRPFNWRDAIVILAAEGGPLKPPGAKTGPKPAGEGPHNVTRERRIQEKLTELKKVDPNWEHTHGGVGKKEEWIPTPGGEKKGRRPDYTLGNDVTKEKYRENIGKTDSNGKPIPREQRALDDIDKFTGGKTGYEGYDQPKK